MLPTNVMSFMKKMVATNESAPSGDPADSGTLSKLRQTLSSGLMTAQDRVTKLSPARQSQAPQEAVATPTDEKATPKPEEPPKSQKTEAGKPPCRTGTCRVCLKSFKPNDFFRTCFECQQKVCEDCASYSKIEASEDETSWRCSICRRKLQSRTQPIVSQESTDILLDVPVVEALQRRHSDIKIGSGSAAGSGGSGLAPPRSPELRRHSDVSPASLKELEKVAGERREELRWEREMEWRQHKRGSSTGREPLLKPDEGGGGGGGGGGRSRSGSVCPLDQQAPDDPDEAEEWRRRRGRTRRKSRVQKQHSYDDDVKNGGGAPASQEPALALRRTDKCLGSAGLPAQLPRRASAYDVYATRESMAPAAPGGRQEAAEAALGRRPSFRVGKPPGIYDFDTNGADDQKGFEGSQHPLSPDGSPGLAVEEERRTRRRGSQLPDLGMRALPPTPPLAAAPRPPHEDPVRRQASVADGEAIKIVIHDVDSDPVARPGSKRRLVLRRDPGDKGHRTRGFGMRVVGGKTGTDGHLFAYIVWTVPGGPAEKAGLQQGDKVLEWDGVALVDRSFEEVCAVMDRAGEVAELLVEHATDLRMCDLLDDPGSMGSSSRKTGDTLGTQGAFVVSAVFGDARSQSCCLPKVRHVSAVLSVADADPDKAPTSPTRRKLPKTPEQMARERQVSGRVQLQVFYHDEKRELVVSVLAADDLASREDTGYGNQPEAFLKLRLLPDTGENCTAKSEVAEPTQNPIWNATFDFPNVNGESLMERTIEVTLWDYCPDRESVFLGECTVELKKAFLEDRPTWYRLEDPRQLRMGKSPHASPRGSLASELAQRLVRRSDFGLQRSFSDDKDSDEKSNSPELCFLHPDHAYVGGSRRGSSQSEVLEVETYQLNRDYSRSLPGSRRSSFQSAQGTEKGTVAEAEAPPPTYVKERRRSSCARVMRDPDEILRNLKAVKGELALGRTMSLSGEKRAHRRASVDSIVLGQAKPRPQRRASRDALIPSPLVSWNKERKQSILDVPEKPPGCSSPSDDEDRGREEAEERISLGPGQIHPRGYRLTCSQGQLRLRLLMTKGQLEVEVVCALGIPGEGRDTLPDTYVKTYLRDGDRWLQKRKTRVARHSCEPQFRQTLRYSACDVLGRGLLVMLWQSQKGWEHNTGLGGAEIALDQLQLTQPTEGWYPLFPIHSLGSDSNDSP
ncbi:regulating synaptic membrane exocytosis protein 2 [Bacillus rossius redtenbacheri]|uniref:regulating synaptic membrane exocytosis protein 2 n=1 Tax=Bacillus rossius redtenbacheri TaxID=93214 RepID=UPI002FDE55BD